VGTRHSVSKEQVYPRFHSVAALWMQAAAGRAAIRGLASAARALASFATALTSTLGPDVTRAARAAMAAGAHAAIVYTPPRAQAEAEAEAAAGKDTDGQMPEILSLDEASADLPLDFQGYCPVALASPVFGSEAGQGNDSLGLGILLPGDPAVGVLRWQGCHIVCSSRSALAAFRAAPRYYTGRVAALATHHLELVQLLQVLGIA
jgi:hypothetical protein